MTAEIRSRLEQFPAALAERQALNAVIADISQLALAGLDQAGRGPLEGRLMAVKDNLNLVGTATTCASRILAGYISPYTATPVQRLLDAGASIAAKTNLDEFAMGSSTEHSCFGPTRNPHDPELVPGGSSGGSAVVVATGLVDMALGSDTGGSVRQPAAFCGVYGLKPTYGRVSRYGLVAFASSFDQVGVFATTTEDTARVFEVIAGHDPLDSTSAPEPVTTFAYDAERAGQLTVGIAPEYGEGVEPEIQDRLDSLVAFLKGAGLRVKEVSLPHTEYGIAAYYVLTTAEASSNLARFDGVRYGLRQHKEDDLEALYSDTRSAGFGPEVQRRIMLGTYVLSAGYMDKYYTRAQRVRRLIKEDFSHIFGEVDLLLTPTAPTFPFPIGGRVEDPLAMYLGDVFTVPMSLAGVPAMSIPVGSAGNGLPVGLQLSANYFQEETIFQLSRFIEQNYSV
ncbi:MAG: Asp-tRNA(Asn)/Glu-tRNA(Gln) amidotransferase subunit GatA [Candidatus Marinimicrobia bacterium]|nr:Asp-tRNA(Asn)/Glu-tRNA(Gln) amidotransferase subunit GatA [Candidatus Neomarinimicrobiota bacterium]